MAGRLAVWVCLVGCSFQPGPSSQREPDARTPADAKVDAPAEAQPDAPQIQDGAVAHPSLVGSGVLQADGDIALTTQGPSDWAHWGYPSGTSFERMAGGSAISDVTKVGGTGSRISVTQVGVSASWANGTPDLSINQTATGTGVNGSAALQLTVPAGLVPHTLDLYVGGKSSRGRITATLSDGSAPMYTDNQFSGGAAWHAKYTLTYAAASANQTLTVIWADDGDTATGGFEMLLSAALR